MERIIEANFNRQVEALQALVHIPSVSGGTPKENMPYGEQVEAALQKALELGRELGFEKVFHVDHRCGVIEYGEGEETLAIMAHLDVVPEGSGWDYPPYGAELHDGQIFGRGTIDNKGPAVCALFALKAIKDSGYKMKRRVRLLLGLDEERGCTGMAHYKDVEGEPTMAFTPDAVYPVVNSEMNIFHGRYTKAYPCSLKAKIGSVANVIPGEAEVLLPAEAKAVSLPEGFVLEAEDRYLYVKGRMGHASMPEYARNALQGLLYALKEQELPLEDKQTIEGLQALLQFDDHGEHMGLYTKDESGCISFMPTLCTMEEKGISLTFDSRYPFSLNYEKLRSVLDERLGALGFVCTEDSNTDGHYIPADSELVSGLMEVYESCTGDKESGTVSMGGGTYAKLFKNAVAFGPVFPGQTDMCHMPNESISLKDMMLNTRIMAKAIIKLACKE